MNSLTVIVFNLFAQTPIMASVLRSSGLRLINLTEQSLLNTRKYQPAIQQACFISGKTLRGSQKLVKARPYDYKNKSYNLLNAIFDKTTHRMDENSKVTLFYNIRSSLKTELFRRLYVSKAHWQPVKRNSLKSWPKNWICCTYQRRTWTWFSSIHMAMICENWILNCQKVRRVSMWRISVRLQIMRWPANSKFVCTFWGKTIRRHARGKS